MVQQPPWKTLWPFFKMLNIVIFDSVILLLGIFPWKLKIYVHTKTCTQIVLEALYMRAQKWKPPICDFHTMAYNQAWRGMRHWWGLWWTHSKWQDFSVKSYLHFHAYPYGCLADVFSQPSCIAGCMSVFLFPPLSSSPVPWRYWVLCAIQGLTV